MRPCGTGSRSTRPTGPHTTSQSRPRPYLPRFHYFHIPSVPLLPYPLGPPAQPVIAFFVGRPTSRTAGDPSSQVILLTDDDLQRTFTILGLAYSEATRRSYGFSVLLWHVFCDAENIYESHRAPASAIPLDSFISTLASGYPESTIFNGVAGVHAWHVLHGLL